MSKDTALIRKTETNDTVLFGRVESFIFDVKPEGFVDEDGLRARFDALKASFSADRRQVAEVSELLFDPDIAAYGLRATAVFARWDSGGGGPSMTALVAAAFDYFDVDLESAGAAAVFAAAILAELPNSLQYHGNAHYRKVLFHAIRLAVTHNHLFPRTEHSLNEDKLIVLLAAACAHDLGHEGGDNQRDGVYTPGAMEQRSFDVARPYFEAAGLEREMIGEIETVIFCTDITFFAGENSPCLRLRKIYKHFFWEDESEDVSLIMLGKLRRYEDNPNLVQIAMMLHEADVGTSAGLSYEQTIIETINIMEERGLKSAGPHTVLAFLREQLGETMFTEAGKQIFGPVMKIVIEQAEHDVMVGRMTYYT